MKRLVAVLLLFLPLSVRATTTVIGHITDLSGTAATSSFVRFTLRGCGGNQPTVNGTSIFAPTQGSVWYKDFPANSTGDISGTIYSTRDVTGLLGGDITCGSSTTSVWYGMTVWQAGKSGPEVAVHAKNTATLNVTSVTPITTTPVVTAPTGDGTYLRLDAGNSPETGAVAFTGNNTFAGNSTFTGPVKLSAASGLWADVTSSTYGAKCDGATDDTTAIQNAINAVAQKGDGTGTFAGGTVYLPVSSTTHACLVSTLNMDGMINVTIAGPGFIEGNPNANATGTLQFTGTCGSGACLSIKSGNGITFSGVTLAFPNATTGPMIDFQHCTVNCHAQTGDAAYNTFHSVAFQGPGGSPPTVGPIVSIPTGEFFRFDGWSTFKGASVFVKGANDNTTFTDLISFDKVFFNIPGTAAVQNAGVAWSFTGIDFNSGQGITANCIPFLAYTATNVAMQDLTITASEFNVGPVGCLNTFTLISTPTASGNLGAFTFIGNLVLAPSGSTSGTALFVGNSQAFTSNGNVFQNWNTVYSLGTNTSVDIGPNIYATNTTFLAGTPLNGRVLDSTGFTTLYSGSNATLKIVNGSTVLGGGTFLSATEGVSTGASLGQDVCAGDSTAHALKCSWNNGAFNQVDLISNTSTTTTQVLHASATAGTGTYSAIATADIATALTTPGPIGGTTPGTGKFTSMTATNLLWSTTAPTIAGAGCGGTLATISANNGTGAFSIFTGTAPTSACTVTMPAATTGWVCDANTVSATTTTNFIVKQTGAVSTTSVILTLFTDVAATQSYTASDTIRVKCSAY